MPRLHSPLRPPLPQAAQGGFTLVELVIVLALIGVLAVFAAPRLTSTGDIRARSFHDATLGYLRYAQKTAVAQRRTVCVSFTTTGLTLSMATNTGVFTCATAVATTAFVGPNLETPPTLAAPGGVSYTALPANLNFDSLGQPLDAGGVLLAANRSLQVQASSGALPVSITVEAITGYVHD